MSKNTAYYNKKEARWGIIFALPAILGFFLWTAGPMIASLLISLTDWKIGGTPNFIGIDNYIHMFTNDPLFPKSIWATLYFTLGSVPLILIFSFLVAILLNQKVKFMSFFRTVFYMPSIAPVIASSVLWMWLFNPDFGLLNNVLQAVGLHKLMWIYDENQVIPSLIMMNLWGMGNTMIIFLAGLQGIPEYLYEAVDIDGGNWWDKFRIVTIPMMSPTIFFNMIMLIIDNMQVFSKAYVMTDGGPNNSSLFYVFYLYRTAFTHSEFGYASALAWILFIIILILTIIVFKTSNKWIYYEGGSK
jgi:multiple sugar transport system permease protein